LAVAALGSRRATLALVCLVLPLAVYWRTAYPSVHTLDTAEYATAVATNGLVHSPGYPTYLLFARLALLPGGLEPARALNLLSGLCAAASAAALALLLRHLTGSGPAAAAAALFFAFTQYQWSEATIATPYTLNALLLVVDLALIAAWRRQRRLRWLALLAPLVALQTGVHAAIALQAPGFALLLLGSDWRWFRSPSRLALLGLLGALGLLVWLELPLRARAAPPLDFARDLGFDLSRPADLWLYVSSDVFRASFFGYPLPRLPAQFGQALLWLAQNALGAGIPLGLLGLGAQWRRDRLLAAALALGFALHFTFYAAYDVANKDTMFLPAHLLWAIWIGEGLAWLQRQVVLERRPLLVGAALLLPLLPLLGNYARLDASANRDARALAEQVLAQAGPNAALYGYWLEITPVQYLLLVERQRPDLEAVNLSTRLLRRLREARVQGQRDESAVQRGFAAEVQAEILARLGRGQSVYLFQPVGSEPPTGWRYLRVGPLWQALAGQT
jgi:transmembrane protein TMEM260 (protein O-mannosyltransferase)